MNKDKVVLEEFAKKVAELNLVLNCEFSTKNSDYEIVTYIDEVQILDYEENLVYSVQKAIKKS